MTKGEGRIRVAVLCEDLRTQNFIRRSLEALGIEGRRIRFVPVPHGRGAAEAWVRANYPREVAVLRARNYQRDLALVAVSDGDAVGVEHRKEQLDAELEQRGMSRRGSAERIATPVPTWAIENWLLALLGQEVDEERGPGGGGKWKDVFDGKYGRDERSAIQTAATAFVERRDVLGSLPSLTDGRAEFDRIHGG